MTLREFLRGETLVGELCIIRIDGWRIGAAWIDHEDLFCNGLPQQLMDKNVKSDELGTIEIIDQGEVERKVACHYIDV